MSIWMRASAGPSDEGGSDLLCGSSALSPHRSGLGAGSRAAIHQLPFPGKRMPRDGVDVVELRRPVEQRADAAGVGHHGGRIARSPVAQADREVDPGDALDRLDHLQDGIAPGRSRN
jgi:hypothetical protein